MTKLNKINASLIPLAFALTAMTPCSAGRQVPYETAQREAGEPIMAIISIESQEVTFYDSNGWIHRAPVSTGTQGRETPAGIFSVVEKNREHRSNMYDDAEMPHMQRITWNGIALHGGPLPGYAASHGCVRMPFDFAARVFDKTRIGMRVIISPYDAAPIEFFHPILFSPDAEVVAAAPERADRLKLEAAEASKELKQAKKNAKTTARKVVLQKRSLRKLEWRKKRADAKLKRANKALSAAAKAKVQAYVRLEKAVTNSSKVTKQLDAAKSALEEKAIAAAAATKNVKDATQASEKAKSVEKSTAREVKLQKEAIGKLVSLKKEAEAEQLKADEALSVTSESKVQAEKQLREATAETTELATKIKSAESDLEPLVEAANAAAEAASNATKISDEAKEVERTALRVVSLRKETLHKLKSLLEKANTEHTDTDQILLVADNASKMPTEEQRLTATAQASELAAQIKHVESDLKVRVTAAAAVTTIANNTTQVSDEAKKVERDTAREVELQKEAIHNLKSIKEQADAELISAKEALSVADNAKMQAEEQLQKATTGATELATQVKTAESELDEKITAADTAATAANDAALLRDEAKKVEKSAASEVQSQKEILRKLKRAQKKADAELKRADRTLSVADKNKKQAKERQRKATTEAKELATQLDIAKSDLKEKIVAATIAKEAVKTGKIRKAETAQAAYEAKLALEPVSVYISRATQKLYVRRNTHKPAIDGGGEEYDSSIEVPITIRDPDIPIGTHIFTAMNQNELGLSWTAVTIDNGEDARSALERITIPQNVLDRIAPTALPRSSIIISDEPLSRETNYRTEFVAVLSNYPKGGFITRKPTPVPVPDTDVSSRESNEESSEENNIVRRRPGFLNL